jgi:hypothetical protein
MEFRAVLASLINEQKQVREYSRDPGGKRGPRDAFIRRPRPCESATTEVQGLQRQAYGGIGFGSHNLK